MYLMDKKRVFVQNGMNIFRVDKISNPKLETKYLCPGYDFQFLHEGLTETGFLRVFKLDSKDSTLPCFIGRWDQSTETLDIDIMKVGSKASESFRNERNGYAGHHPTRTADPERKYQLKILLPEKPIFEGYVSFNINHGHAPGLFKSV